MKDVCRVTVIGRLGADPVMKQSAKGNPWVQFPVATSRKNPSSETGEETQWLQVSVWGKSAEHCEKYLAKGDSVYVDGGLKIRRYENKKGETATSIEVSANDVCFFPKRNKKNSFENLATAPQSEPDLQPSLHEV